MKKGEYPAKTIIADIAWDSHLTDLRVVVTNPTADDYENLDVEIQPDKWTYKAALFTNNSGCQLSPMPARATMSVVLSAKGGATTVTVTHAGTAFDSHDNAGDVFVPLITESGYRLRCAKLPAHFSVQVVFALAVVDTQIAKDIPLPMLKPGQLGLSMAEYDTHADSFFEVFGLRPIPSIVQLKGRYFRSMKPFKVESTIAVNDGN